jgi:hypothetical protein
MSLPFIFGFFSFCKVLLGWLWMKRVRARVRVCVTRTQLYFDAAYDMLPD